MPAAPTSPMPHVPMKAVAYFTDPASKETTAHEMFHVDIADAVRCFPDQWSRTPPAGFVPPPPPAPELDPAAAPSR